MFKARNLISFGTRTQTNYKYAIFQKREKGYERSQRTPQKTFKFTNKEAEKLLLQSNIISSVKDDIGISFLKSLRQNYIRYGSLTDKQLDALYNMPFIKAVIEKRDGKLSSKVFVDPIQTKLLLISNDDYNKIEQKIGEDVLSKIKNIRAYLIKKGFLSMKQMRFVGSILLQIGIDV